MTANEVSQTGYFCRSGIISNSFAVANNGKFETLGPNFSNETPLEFACVRTI